MPKNIAIIPARGGSKRLPGKNILPLGGKPLLAHSILYAKQFSHIIEEVYVSTDDKAIASIAVQFGARVIERPASISGDFEPTITALQHVLASIDEGVGVVFLLQPTNPLRPTNLIEKAWGLFQQHRVDSLVTVSEKIVKLGTIVSNTFTPSTYTFGQRSQDVTPLYEENGLLYITKASKIEEGVILAKNNYAYVVSSVVPKIDIDTEEDFKKASRYFKTKEI